MRLVVNGAAYDCADGATVAQLVRAVGGRDRGSAVAVDGVVVRRREWDAVELRDGQVVELVHAVQGG